MERDVRIDPDLLGQISADGENGADTSSGAGTAGGGLISPEGDMEACKSRRVLVVDDDEFNREVLSAILSMAGAEVTTVPDGPSALRALTAGMAFDAVLMDVQMPGMDGFETTRRIRENSQWADLPVLAITANVVRGVRKQCLEAGMNDFLTKPVDSAALFQALTRWTGGRS